MSGSERKIFMTLGCIGVLLLFCTGAMGVLYLSQGGAEQLSSIGLTEQRASGEAVSVAEALREEQSAEDEAVADAPSRVRERESESREDLPLRGVSAEGIEGLPRLYQQVNPGVVSIAIRQVLEFGGQALPQQGGGSGFVYDDRHIVTNNHVAGDAEDIEVVFFDGSRRRGELVGADADSDLAVIRVEDIPESARVLPLEDDFASLLVGQPVIAIGAPFGRANSMTYGIISALGRTIPADPSQGGGFNIPETIQTDAAINPGNSGGPLLNLEGEVIGVNAQINSGNVAGLPANSGVGFSIPASILERVVPELIDQGRVEWSFLGVSGLRDEMYTIDVAEANGFDEPLGAYISGVVDGGPSEGVLQGDTDGNPNPPYRGGDVIVGIDDTRVDDFDDLLTYISLSTRPGQEVRLTVLRGGEQVELRVVVGARPVTR